MKIQSVLDILPFAAQRSVSFGPSKFVTVDDKGAYVSGQGISVTSAPRQISSFHVNKEIPTCVVMPHSVQLHKAIRKTRAQCRPVLLLQ